MIPSSSFVESSCPQTSSSLMKPADNVMPSLEETLTYLTLLKRLYGQDAKPTSQEQLETIHHVVLRRFDVLFVAPTGSGKTAVILLPCLHNPTKTTVLVVPYVSLVRQFVSNCIEFEIPHQVWSPDQPIRSPCSILIVSVEHIDAAQLHHDLTVLHQWHRLDRIVLDEIHLYLTEAEFRDKLDRSLSIRRGIPVPLLLLTATLPPYLEQILKGKLQNQDITTIRLPSQRSNMAFECIQFSFRSQLVNEFVRQVETATRIVQGRNRAIVFVLSRADVDEVSGYLTQMQVDHVVHHSGLTRDQRENNAAKWIAEAGTHWMIATSGFGVGIHHPHVRFVIHFGGSHSVLAYYQECGRGGRDGVIYRAVLLTCASFSQRYRDGTNLCLWRWLEQPGCRWSTLAAIIDGKPSLCCVAKKKALPCDRCSPFCQHSNGNQVDLKTTTTTKKIQQKENGNGIHQAKEKTNSSDKIRRKRRK